MRRTKIVCTIGPATESPDMLEKMIRAGMNVARLNFSHGSHEEHGKVIATVRSIANRLKQPVAILQDLAGPKIRTGFIANGPVMLKQGQMFILTSEEVPGDSEKVSITYKNLPKDVYPGDILLLSDGDLELTVEEKSEKEIKCRVRVGGLLDSHKGINLPERSLNIPILSDKDRDDLAFGIEQGVDYIALSFVRTAEEVEEVRELVKKLGKRTALIAKIEKHEALKNIDEIIKTVDGIMVARGDLGVEIPIEDVPRVQKMLIEKANRAGKPVITATQMLKSMVDNPRPTRAEVTDVANAILDGSDAVMLSEESTVGKYPVEAVNMLSRIARSTELAFPFQRWLSKFEEDRTLSIQEAVAHSACQIARWVNATAILTSTKSGSTTRLVAKYRPPQPILAMTPDEITYRKLTLVWGAIPIMIGKTKTAEELEKESVKLALKSGYVKKGELMVFTAGLPLNVTGTTNLTKIVTVQ